MKKRKNYFESSPSYGLILKEFKRFNDLELFKGKSYLFTRLNKIKLWYGTAIKDKDKDSKTNNNKAILGVEANYRLLKKPKGNLNRHTSPLNSNDIITKELKLDNNDYFCKLNLCFDDVITYIKLESKNGKKIELGNYNESTAKNIWFNNDKENHIIQTLNGFYDDKGIRALGVRHISLSRYGFINKFEILVLRYRIKKNEQQKKYWENEKNIKKINIGMQAVVKAAMLPDNSFGYVFKYLVD